LAHLSDIELYFTPPELVKGDEVIIAGDEFHHSVNVMRNRKGDILFVTNGNGTIFKSEIVSIKKDKLTSGIIEKNQYENKAENLWFCIPVLKNPDRLKFAFEKCVELGITNFILFHSKYTASKNLKPEKFHKIVLAAMKQSLRAYLPKIISSSFADIVKPDRIKFLFDQNANKEFDNRTVFSKPVYFLFGPEGGFDEKETAAVDPDFRFKLSGHRLRSETTVVKLASLLNL
jgi:16S rRNA (uracil1498-N3)-methyltransferase